MISHVARVVSACLALSLAVVASDASRNAPLDDIVQKTVEYETEMDKLKKLEGEYESLRQNLVEEARKQQEVSLEIGLARKLGPPSVRDAGLDVTRFETADGLTFSVEARKVPLQRLLSAVALSAGFKLEVDEQVPAEALNRRVDVAVHGAPMCDVFEILAGLEGLWVEVGTLRVLVGPPAALAGGSMRQALAGAGFRAYQRALLRFPRADGAPRAYCGIAEYYLIENQAEAAAQTLRTMIENHPDSEERRRAFHMLADALKRLGRTENARRAYQKYLAAFPGDSGAPEATLSIADSYAAAGEYARAAESYAQLAERWPASPQARRALVARARVLMTLGDFEHALATLKEVGEKHGDQIGDDLPQVEYMTGMCLARTGHAEQGSKLLASFLERYRNTPMAANAYGAVGDSLMVQKDYTGAILVFQKLLRDFPRHEGAAKSALRIAECYRLMKLPGQAAESVRQYIAAQQPQVDVDDLVLQAARDFLEAGRASAAVQVLQRLVAPAGTEKAVAGRLLRCRALLYQGSYVDALRELEETVAAAKADEQRDAALRMLGDCYNKTGRPDLAARAYMGVTEQAPADKQKERASDEAPRDL